MPWKSGYAIPNYIRTERWHHARVSKPLPRGTTLAGLGCAPQNNLGSLGNVLDDIWGVVKRVAGAPPAGYDPALYAQQQQYAAQQQQGIDPILLLGGGALLLIVLMRR